MRRRTGKDFLSFSRLPLHGLLPFYAKAFEVISNPTSSSVAFLYMTAHFLLLHPKLLAFSSESRCIPTSVVFFFQISWNYSKVSDIMLNSLIHFELGFFYKAKEMDLILVFCM